MNYCDNCTPIKPIPTCSALVNLGRTTLISTDVLLLIADNTGREWTREFTTDAEGDAIVDFSEFDFISPNFVYYVQVIEGLDNYNSPKALTINTVDYTCLTMQFDRVKNDTGVYSGADAISAEIL